MNCPDDTPTVSAIIPIRNGSTFLENCVGYISAQTYGNFETIFVIDANSTDDTIDKAKSLMDTLRNSRIIIQEKNLKLGGNRNLGLLNSNAEYVWFLDVDDAPSPHFISEMVTLAEKTESDFVCCNFINTDPSGIIREKPNRKYSYITLDRDGAVAARNHDMIPVSTWSKLFRREFLIDNDLLFEDTMAEDIIHTYRCINACHRICIYDRPLYAYRIHTDSMCNKDPDLRGRAEIEAYNQVDRLFPNDESVLHRNAIMKIRSSGHMSYRCFRDYAKSTENRESYERYLKGTLEGWWHIHLPTLYWVAIRTYIVTVYKRRGSPGMCKKIQKIPDDRSGK